MTNLTPIQTEYRNIVFRSRLEAKWAVFFDEMGIEWKYEPGTFMVPFGGYSIQYRPDFALTNVKCVFDIEQPIYIEVKGRDHYCDIYEYERRKIENFAKDHSILVLGKIPYKVSDMFQEPDYICNFILINGQNMPCFFRKYNDVPWLVDGYRLKDGRQKVDSALYIANKACFSDMVEDCRGAEWTKN